jgi:hypothetical protein
MPEDKKISKASDVEFIEALSEANKGSGVGVWKALVAGAVARGIINGVTKQRRK